MAQSVFATALKMCDSFKQEDNLDSILLLRSWTWELLEDGDLQGAFSIILNIGKGKTTRESDNSIGVTTALLKARRVVYYADLLALLAYLYQNRAIDKAVAEYRRAAKWLAHRPSEARSTLELLHQAKARLLYHHAVNSHYFRPALLREEFAESIKQFPQNTIFLSLYAWNEARFRIDDRVRSMLWDVALRSDEETVIGWVFSIWNESHGTLGAGHNANSTRAVFERAIASSSCPWAKELYMLAFTHLTSVMDNEELRRIYEVIREKELRIRVGLEDVFERWDQKGSRQLAP
ncbi:MAG: hypothetical protein M1826_001621 [Phylliscum demangeonii]|nr:MAG: hypothetical protein M1826_001621 [Phylliscum demangeonii]